MRRWRCFFPSKKQPPASHAAFPLSVPGCLLWTNSCRSRSASWKQSTGVDSQSQLQEKDVEFLGVSWNKSWKLKTNRCLLFTIFYLLDVDAMYISYITYITCIILGVQIWHTKKKGTSAFTQRESENPRSDSDSHGTASRHLWVSYRRITMYSFELSPLPLEMPLFFFRASLNGPFCKSYYYYIISSPQCFKGMIFFPKNKARKPNG